MAAVPSSSKVTIRPLQTHDITPGVKCIQTAFSQDPYFKWVFPNPSQFNAARNLASLRARFYWGMRHALFHVAVDSTSQKLLGVGCWLTPTLATPTPPKTWAEWWAHKSAEWDMWFRQLFTNFWYFGRGGLSVRRYYAWKEAQAQAQEALWDDPKGYYFCNIITVNQEAQGKGVGRALVEHVTKVADREGRKCYLESSRYEPNVPIYEKMGFKLVREMQCREDDNDEGITLYCMTREPQQP